MPNDPQFNFYKPNTTLTSNEEKVVDLLLSGFLRQLTETVTAFPKEISHNIRLQNDVYDDLGLQDGTRAESEYYKQHSDYIKALLEDYVRRSYYDR